MPRLVWLVRRVVATTLLAAVAFAVSSVPAGAAGESAATCTLNITLTLRPGLTLLPTSGSIVSETPGSLNCIGLIDGNLVIGPGRFAVRGDYSGSIAAGTTTGKASYSIPTTAGVAGGTVNYNVIWVGIAGFITVEDPVYGNGVGPFAFLPRGLSPVTSIQWLSQQITFGSGAPTSVR